MSADFWAGYISGAAGIIIGNPLDLVKTRLQAGKVVPADATLAVAAAPQTFRGHFESTGTLLKGEQSLVHADTSMSIIVSNWQELHSIGATAPMLGYGALNALIFITYNRTLALLNDSPTSPSSLSKVWLAGATGGLASFVVSAPTELIKCQAQVSTEPNTSSWSIAKDVWRRDGIRGLYYGGGVTSVRDAVGYGF
jgi:solute carrier family 25 carnitine/acylcarnitine transporter 20/29